MMEFLTPGADGDSHSLLETRSPAYSHATVRRAFIVWLRCGQKNQFRDVCNYYHRLEALEDQLPTDVRASSRHHEFSLFVEEPPTSPYLQEMFPNLYSSAHVDNQAYSQAYLRNYHTVFEQKVAANIEEANNAKTESLIDAMTKIKTDKEKGISDKDIFEASQVFRSDCKVEAVNKNNNRIGLAFARYNVEGIKKISEEITVEAKPAEKVAVEATGTSKKDILETSQMIKKYCKDQQVPLKNFLENFKEYATRCELNNTVNNVGFYIKRKMIHSELGLAIKVHRAKVYKENKENLLRNALPTKNMSTKCETFNVDNAVLINGFAQISFAAKAKENVASKKDLKIKKVLTENFDNNNIDLKEKSIKLLKKEEFEALKNINSELRC